LRAAWRDEEVPDWLTPELLQRMADQAQARFLANHPGEANPSLLIEEAKRRVTGWAERHHQDPYDEAHVLRLMKTAINDRYQRTRRTRSKPDRDADPEEDAD
jgi:hypothetical protein